MSARARPSLSMPLSPRRRDPVRAARTLAAGLALALLAALPGCGERETAARDPNAPTPRPERPDVVVIVLDTTRADRVSFAGYGRPTTPRLDAFAKDAVVYENCWSPSPWTAPSHASLFTGLRVENHGLHRDVASSLPAAPPTLAERLKAAGYATAGFSTNPNVSRVTGLQRGFDLFEQRLRGEMRRLPDMPGHHEAPQSAMVGAHASAQDLCDAGANWALGRRAKDKPFLLFVNVLEPHLPYDPPQDVAAPLLSPTLPADDVAWARAFQYPLSAIASFGAGEVSDTRRQALRELYDAEIATADRAVGALLDRLLEGKARDRTVVVVVGDHGENLGERRKYDHLYGLDAALLRVPCLIRAPGALQGGRRERALVRITDIAPTLLELCGAPAFEPADGLSLLGDLGARTSLALVDPPYPSQLKALEEWLPGADISAIRRHGLSATDGRLHLTRGDGRPDRLFDVALDPDEEHDIIDAHPAEADALRALLRAAGLKLPGE